MAISSRTGHRKPISWSYVRFLINGRVSGSMLDLRVTGCQSSNGQHVVLARFCLLPKMRFPPETLFCSARSLLFPSRVVCIQRSHNQPWCVQEVYSMESPDKKKCKHAGKQASRQGKATQRIQSKTQIKHKANTLNKINQNRDTHTHTRAHTHTTHNTQHTTHNTQHTRHTHTHAER